jgi:hypothetical protein
MRGNLLLEHEDVNEHGGETSEDCRADDFLGWE